jgi:16S rRNA U516 pseudouridylate synthase RsuA-like enzyme
MTVSRLIRVRYGSVSLPRELRRGKNAYLDKEYITKLRESVGLDLRAS